MTRILTPQAFRRSSRRGNTLVLVTAILVLLVIVATAYISRTRVGRATAAAQQQATIVDDRAESIGTMLASEVAEALFVRPVQTPVANNGFFGGTVSSNWPRLPIFPDEGRFGVDPARVDVSDPNTGEVRKFYEFPYNKASYATIPWTNWPDALGAANSLWPVGPGAPGGLLANGLGGLIGAGNPYGNPGFDDSRWLRSTEPQRSPGNFNGQAVEGFTHWLHLTNISRPDNGWRIAWDISDVRPSYVESPLPPTGPNGEDRRFANVLDNLQIPVEQWLPTIVPNGVASAADFRSRRDGWFGENAAGPIYAQSYLQPNTTLPNFFRLADLGLPNDEFVRNTDRWLVSTLFSDADGDGFTDSYWFLAPEPIDRDVRQVVGISIVDNSALLNVNVASLFDPQSSTGANPADLALLSFTQASVGFLDNPANRPPTQVFNFQAPSVGALTGTGFEFDRYGAGDTPNASMFLQQRGLRDADGDPNPLFADRSLDEDLQGILLSPLERLAYFNGDFRGRGPEALGLIPFGAPEELELRANHGQNNPVVTTRLERAFDDGGLDFSFLRATPFREETNEYLDQLKNPQLVHDNRRKITAFSGARNDLSPPWLWSSPRFETDIDYNRDGFAFAIDGGGTPNAQALLSADRATWEAQRRKFDLRRPMDEPQIFSDGSLVEATPAEVAANKRIWREELRRLLRQTMTLDYTFRDGTTRAYQSYLGRPDDSINEGRDAFRLTRRMLGSWAANIDQWRDGPERREFPDDSVAFIDRPLNPRNIQEAVLYPDPSDPAENGFPDERVAFIGNEKHPVIVEVFFALVFPRSKVVVPEWLDAECTPPPTDLFACPWSPGQGENFVQFDPNGVLTEKPAVVFAVQLANPYDTPVHLWDFSLRVSWENETRQVPLGLAAATQLGVPFNVALQPTTPERPCSMVVFNIPASYLDVETLGQFAARFQEQWLDYLDLEPGDLFDDPINDSIPDPETGDPYRRPESMVVDGTSFLTLPWDVFKEGDARIEIVRNYLDDSGANPVSVVVDRFEQTDLESDNRFSESAALLYRPDHLPPPPAADPDCLTQQDPPEIGPNAFYSGLRIRNKSVFVTWARASRMWLRDLDLNGVIDRDEMGPRFAISLGDELEAARVIREQEGVNAQGLQTDYTGDVIGTLESGGPTGGGQAQVPDDPDAVSDAQMWLTGFTFESQFAADDGEQTIRSKPVFFPMQAVVSGNARTYEGYQYVAFDPSEGNPVRWGEKGAPAIDQYRDGRNFGRFAFQFSQKDRDFEQIGEIANVPLWGPEVRYPIPADGRAETVRTLSEILADEDDLDSETHPIEPGVYRNRFRTFAGFEVGLEPDLDTNEIAVYPEGDDARQPVPVLGAAPGGLDADQESEWEAFFATRPRLPAGVGLFDALVCDDRGMFWRDTDGDLDVDTDDLLLARLLSPANARGFTGAATPGLVNLNTAPVEVLRTLPHFTRLVYNDSDFEGSVNPVNVPDVASPRVRLPEAFLRYRDQTVSPASAQGWGEPNASQVALDLPDYLDRGLAEDELPGVAGFFAGMRNHRGVESIGELRLLQRVGNGNDDGTWGRRLNGSIEFAGLDPFRGPSLYEDEPEYGYRGTTFRFDTRLATDRTIGIDSTNPEDETAFLRPDNTPGDAEERNLLFSGVSNLVGVRSDVFTVYFRVRTFRRNPITGIWDATDPEHILGDDRYVMLVDRSKVERPEDKPEIVFFQKLAY